MRTAYSGTHVNAVTCAQPIMLEIPTTVVLLQSNGLQYCQQAAVTTLLDPCIRLTEFGKAISRDQDQEAGPIF